MLAACHALEAPSLHKGDGSSSFASTVPVPFIVATCKCNREHIEGRQGAAPPALLVIHLRTCRDSKEPGRERTEGREGALLRHQALLVPHRHVEQTRVREHVRDQDPRHARHRKAAVDQLRVHIPAAPASAWYGG